MHQATTYMMQRITRSQLLQSTMNWLDHSVQRTKHTAVNESDCPSLPAASCVSHKSVPGHELLCRHGQPWQTDQMHQCYFPSNSIMGAAQEPKSQDQLRTPSTEGRGGGDAREPMAPHATAAASDDSFVDHTALPCRRPKNGPSIYFPKAQQHDISKCTSDFSPILVHTTPVIV